MVGYPSAAAALASMRALVLLGVISCVMGIATIFVAVAHFAAFGFPWQGKRMAAQRAQLYPGDPW